MAEEELQVVAPHRLVDQPGEAGRGEDQQDDREESFFHSAGGFYRQAAPRPQ
jgi:hypothetical protein